MFLAERFHHLLDAEDELGLIVVDSRFREDDQRLRRFFADLTKDGTPYMQLPRIVEGLFLGTSHYSIGKCMPSLVCDKGRCGWNKRAWVGHGNRVFRAVTVPRREGRRAKVCFRAHARALVLR